MDRRRIPVRHDLAAEHLRGEVDSVKYVEGTPMQVGVSLLNLATNPNPSTSMATQLLFGEEFTVYDEIPDIGLSWGQCGVDGYVGYVATEGLVPVDERKTRAITALSALVYSKPDLKSTAVGAYSMGCRVYVEDETDGFACIGEGLYVPLQYFAEPAADFVTTAEKFIGVPYLWAGRSFFGLDCSALVQLSLQSIGVSAPRDSDVQRAELGEVVQGDKKRGDLVFWDGHVGIMQSETQLLHASAHDMAVTSEPLSDVEARSVDQILAVKRP